MRAGRMAMSTVLAATLAVALAAPAAAEDPKTSKSAVQAAALAKQLAQAKLQYIATKDPTEPGRFVAAMHLPGAQLMLVSARYGAPTLLNEKVLLGKFQDAYIDLNSASEAATRIIVEDLRADGFALTKGKDMMRDSFESNGKRVFFDFDWRKQKLTQAEYFSTLEAADTQYARMLELLIAEAQKSH
jgi:hypothetical protein